MNNPTHFIEVFSKKNNFRGRTEQGVCQDIFFLPMCIAGTATTKGLKTVAIFKIKMK